jgi:hypothetical protein
MSAPKLPSSELDLVSHNLQTLYLVAHQPSKSFDLVPSLIGHQIHSPTFGWRGRILRVIYAIIACFVGDKYFQSKLKKALEVTKEYFDKLEKSRKYHSDVYEDYLDNGFENWNSRFLKEENPNEIIDNARQQILLFYQATKPLTQLIHKKSNEKLNEFLKKHFQSLFEEGKAPFYDKTTFKALKGYVKLMTIEGFAQGELPLDLFKKIFVKHKTEQKPSDKVAKEAKADEKKLSSFISKMKKAKVRGDFNVKDFHSAMQCLVDHLKAKKDKTFDVKLLEKALIAEGCIFLHEFDKKHVQWRQTLKKGNSLIKENENFYFMDDQSMQLNFVLGDVVPGSDKKEDLYHVYEIHDSKNLEKKFEEFLMLIGPNKVCLEYSEILRTDASWGLATPVIHFIHPEGKYAIVERLPHSIESIEWKSSDKLHDEDIQYAASLMELIQFFVEEKNSPKDLKAENLRFDDKGRLKSTKDCIPNGCLDLLALEEMVYHLAQKKNLPIYQYLMEPLRNEDYAKETLMPFFREAIQSVFKENSLPIEILAQKREINVEAVIKRGRDLQIFAHEVKEACIKSLHKHYRAKKNEKLLSLLSKQLLIMYEESKTLGRFWDSFKHQDLVKVVTKELLQT